ncbi:MAG: tetratricopeptide repeat protein [Acidobacteriota bacterium]|nr:tetratricopeptide repeat protein [Acidobacteriota bacterium]
MNQLRSEIERMLEQKTPEQILDEERERLSFQDREKLEEQREALLETDHLLTQLGEKFREDMPPVPDLGLPPDFNAADELPWRQRRVSFSAGTLALAATLLLTLTALFTVPWSTEPETDSILRNTRSADETVDLKPYNDRLFEALLERGIFLLELGDKTGKPAYYREALYELKSAEEFGPNHPRVLEHLAKTYERLGESRKARDYLEKLTAVDGN